MLLECWPFVPVLITWNKKRHLSALEKQSVWHGLSHRLPCSAPPAVMLPIPPTPAHSCLRAFELAVLTAVLFPHRAIWCSLSSGLGLAASFSAEPTLPAFPPPLPSSVALSPLNVLCISQVHLFIVGLSLTHRFWGQGFCFIFVCLALTMSGEKEILHKYCVRVKEHCKRKRGSKGSLRVLASTCNFC